MMIAKVIHILDNKGSILTKKDFPFHWSLYKVVNTLSEFETKCAHTKLYGSPYKFCHSDHCGRISSVPKVLVERK